MISSCFTWHKSPLVGRKLLSTFRGRPNESSYVPLFFVSATHGALLHVHLTKCPSSMRLATPPAFVHITLLQDVQLFFHPTYIVFSVQVRNLPPGE